MLYNLAGAKMDTIKYHDSWTSMPTITIIISCLQLQCTVFSRAVYKQCIARINGNEIVIGRKSNKSEGPSPLYGSWILQHFHDWLKVLDNVYNFVEQFPGEIILRPQTQTLCNLFLTPVSAFVFVSLALLYPIVGSREAQVTNDRQFLTILQSPLQLTSWKFCILFDFDGKSFCALCWLAV